MFVVKLDIFCWVAVLMCAGAPLSAAPTSPGRRGVVASDMQPPPTADSPDGPARWERGPSVSRSWRSRTPAEYQDRARQEPTVRQQTTASQSGGGHPRVIGGSQTSNEQPGIKTRSKGKAFVSGVRVAADRWRDGYDVVESRPPSVVRDRTHGATRRPEETVQTRSSPKLSYIQRRRPLGSVATAGRLGSKGTQSTYRPAGPPSQPVLPYVLRPKTTTRPSGPVAIVTIAPPALPPRTGATPLAGSNTFMGKPLITRRPTEHTVLKNGQASTNSKNHLSVINAAGLVPGSIVTKRLSVGLNVPHNGNHPASSVRITHKPQHSIKAPEISHKISTSTIRRKIPHTTKSPSLTPQKTSITVDLSGSTPPLEVLNLYEVGVLPNPSEFFNRQNTSALTSPSDGGTNGRGVSGGGSSKGSTKVTFPLHVLPAIPGAPAAPDWPMVPAGPVRPCCKGRPGLVIPVDPPDRPVYPSIGSGHKPLPPSLRPPIAGHRPVSPPSTSYGPPTRPIGQLTPPGLTPPSRPTRRPCGTGHCVLVPPAPSAPPPTRPPAPPTTGVGTSLGNIGNDLVCVYLRSNGSALVLRADLNTGRYNISDDQNHLLSSPGWLDSNQPQVRDRPSHQHRYDVVYLDNQTATVQQLLTRMRNRTERWEEMHRPQTNIICIVRRPEAVPGNATSSQTPGGPAFKPTESPKPSEEPITPSAIPTPTAEATSTSEPTTTPKPTILGAVDSLSSTIASAVDALGATAETQLATTMSAADQTAVVIGSNVKNYIGTSIPSIALATTVGIPVFVAMLALLGAPPLLLSALSVSSPLLLQGVAVFYNSLPN